MRVLVGTSGFGYREWKGSFYPEKLKADAMLAYYATKLRTVEINNTFYRFPAAEVLEGWTRAVPSDFIFVLKAAQTITHRMRLKECKEAVDSFHARSLSLGARRGAVLVQLPPNFKKDIARLSDFLAVVPAAMRVAFEFRHASWFDDQVYDALKSRDAALCWAESENLVTPPLVTSSWGYLRLRSVNYDEAALHTWADRIRATTWADAFVFFKHEDGATGPRFAATLNAILAVTPPAPSLGAAQTSST